MTENWLLPAAILAAFASMLLLPLAETLLKGVRRVRFHCPFVGREVAVEFVRPTAFGVIGPTDVRSCSAFDVPQAPTCGKGCLKERSREASAAPPTPAA